MSRLICIGECMLELTGGLTAEPTLGFGGDTLNTAVYAARCGAPSVQVAYCTALGDDPFSDRMAAAWVAEGIDIGLVRRIAGRLPGFYAIATDAGGERRFYYWREQAAVRALLLPEAEGAALLAKLGQGAMVYLSGITLAVLDQGQRTRMLGALQAHRREGLKVAFDSNVRPALWPSLDAARAASDAAVACADVLLVGFDDERLLRGFGDPTACARALAAAGPAEVVVKHGEQGSWIATANGIEHVDAVPAAKVVDTTAAGDSFNGAYLVRRLRGDAPVAAAQFAGGVASVVVQHPGALIPKTATPV